MGLVTIPDWMRREVALFGKRTLKMESFALNENGVIGIRLEDGLRLRLEIHEETLFIYTLQPIGESVAEMAELLMEANPRRNHSRPVHVGIYNGQAVRMMKLRGEECTARNIDAVFRWLWRKNAI